MKPGDTDTWNIQAADGTVLVPDYSVVIRTAEELGDAAEEHIGCGARVWRLDDPDTTLVVVAIDFEKKTIIANEYRDDGSVKFGKESPMSEFMWFVPVDGRRNADIFSEVCDEYVRIEKTVEAKAEVGT